MLGISARLGDEDPPRPPILPLRPGGILRRGRRQRQRPRRSLGPEVSRLHGGSTELGP